MPYGYLFFYFDPGGAPTAAAQARKEAQDVNWDSLIRETARRADADYSETKRTLESFFDTVIESMGTDDTVQLRPDFGLFEMREAGGEKSIRKSALPKSRRTPVFKKAGTLKKQLRQDDGDYLHMLRQDGRDAQADRLARKQRSEHDA
jgi:nucleoid DNA-binding protein